MAEEKSQEHQIAVGTKQENQKKLPISEAVILAAISASAYLFAFLYEQSFMAYFGIPTQFVNVSLVTLLTFGAATAVFLICLAGLANVLFSFLPKHPFLSFYIPRYALLGFLTVLVPFFLYEGRKGRLVMLCIWIVLTIGLFVMPLIIYRKKGSWDKRYDAAIEAESGKNIQGLYRRIEERYGVRELGLIVFVVMACLGLASSMGEAEAVNQRFFLVINTKPETVVLRVSGENIICAPFDRNKREVKKSFSIRKVAEDPNLIMNLESVGPLTPVDKLSSETAAPLPTTTPTPTSENTTAPSPTPAQAETPTNENQ